MLAHIPGAVFVAASLALVPAALLSWWARAVFRRLDDPLIAERLAALNTRATAATVATLVLLMMGWPSWFVWTVPLTIAARSVAAYPLRKALYEETWSLAGALAFKLRLTVGLFGFWILLGATPWLAGLAGSRDWLAGLALAAILAAWSRYFTDVTRAILGARPLTDAALLERFDALVAKCGIPAPRFDYVAMRGGVLANALALPSLRRSGVLFTDTLLARLSGDEIVAICAHELAHLEYYNRARLRRFAAMTYALILAAAVTAPVDRLLLPREYHGLGTIIWVGAMIISLAIRGRHKQRNETASDMRAVELTGNAEAVASGLTALYVLARLPRRLDQRRERNATHPSLARRLRDIRGAAAPSAVLHGPATFHAESGPAAVTFEPSFVSWQDHPGSIHRLDYGALSELRLQVASSGSVALIAVERQGRRWQMKPRAEDAAALQSTLDAVDGQLAHDVRAPAFSSAVASILMLVGSLVAVAAGQFAMAFVAMFAALAAVPPLLNGAAAAALLAATIAAVNGGAGRWSIALLLAMVGAGFVILARMRRQETSRLAPVARALLTLSAAGAIAIVMLGGVDPIRLHQAARATPGAAILLAALAAAYGTPGDRRGRRFAAAAFALGAAALTIAGTTTFLDRAGRDALLVAAPRPSTVQIGTTPLASFDVPFEVETLRLSPNGVLAAALPTEDEDPSPAAKAQTFHAGLTRKGLVPVDAVDVTFIDDRRALLLADAGGELEVREATFDPALQIGWRQRVPGVRSGDLSYHRETNRWVLIGYEASGRIARAEGPVGAPGVFVKTWSAPAGDSRWVGAVAANAASALVAEQHYEFGPLSRTRLRQFAPLLGRPYTDARLVRVSGESRIEVARSRLDTTCAAAGEALVCTAYDGTRTHMVSVALETGRIEPIAVLDGRFWATDSGSPGWISGWWDTAPAAIRLATHEAFQPRRIGDEFPTLVSGGAGAIGIVTSLDEGARVRVFSNR